MDGRRQGERLLAIVAPERWDGKPRRRVGATGSGAICGRNEEEPGAPGSDYNDVVFRSHSTLYTRP